MEEALNMNVPSKEVIKEIAQELSVNPSFIEKDFYAVKILEKAATFTCLGFSPVFSGGRSLSKAYGLIKRFGKRSDFCYFDRRSFVALSRCGNYAACWSFS